MFFVSKMLPSLDCHAIASSRIGAATMFVLSLVEAVHLTIVLISCWCMDPMGLDSTGSSCDCLPRGFGGSIDYWRRTMPALAAAGYTVHAMDLLGLPVFCTVPCVVPSSSGAVQGWASLTSRSLSTALSCGPNRLSVLAKRLANLTDAQVADFCAQLEADASRMQR